MLVNHWGFPLRKELIPLVIAQRAILARATFTLCKSFTFFAYFNAFSDLTFIVIARSFHITSHARSTRPFNIFHSMWPTPGCSRTQSNSTEHLPSPLCSLLMSLLHYSIPLNDWLHWLHTCMEHTSLLQRLYGPVLFSLNNVHKRGLKHHHFYRGCTGCRQRQL